MMRFLNKQIHHALFLLIAIGLAACGTTRSDEEPADAGTLGASALSVLSSPATRAQGLSLGNLQALGADVDVDVDVDVDDELPDFDFCELDFMPIGFSTSNEVSAGHYGTLSAGIDFESDFVCDASEKAKMWKSWVLDKVAYMDCTGGDVTLQDGWGVIQMDITDEGPETHIYGYFEQGGFMSYCDIESTPEGFSVHCEDAYGNPIETAKGTIECVQKKPERPDKPEPKRPARPYRPQYPEKPDQPEIPDLSDLPDLPDLSERPERPNCGEDPGEGGDDDETNVDVDVETENEVNAGGSHASASAHARAGVSTNGSRTRVYVETRVKVRVN